MFKTFLTALLFLLLPFGFLLAQENLGNVKTFSGDLIHDNVKNESNFWVNLFGGKQASPRVAMYSQCAIDFKSPVSYGNEAVTKLPLTITYQVNFSGPIPPQVNATGKLIEQDNFSQYIINIYTNDDQIYSIDPAKEGQQDATNPDHHIHDSYLIYLVMSKEKIDHLEVVSPNTGDKYILKNFTIQ